MKAKIICVGSEILYGDTLNTNAHYLTRQLTSMGIEVISHVVAGDDQVTLVELIKQTPKICDVVIFTGGLGPTLDDITKEALALAFGLKMELNQELKSGLENYFKERGYNFPETNYRQAYMPKGSTLLPNFNGTAPGVLYNHGEQLFVLLPGPPDEMKPMFENQVSCFLKEKNKDFIYSKTLKMIGIGESDAEDRILEIIKTSTDVVIAPYAKTSEVHFKITAKGKSFDECMNNVNHAEISIMEILGDYVYTDKSDSFFEVLVDLLIKQKKTIAIAESCTGGWLSKMIVDVPDASKVLLESIVTYSDQAKMKYLKVSSKLLEQFGAVSWQVAAKMALGIKKTANSSVGIGISGIAGPGGGTKTKPVGLVYVSIAFEDKVFVYTQKRKGTRNKIRENAAKQALMYLYFILKNNPCPPDYQE